MGDTTMSFEVPDAMRKYIDERVASGPYADMGDYMRELVYQDELEQARNRLRALIDEGLESGPGRARTSSDRERLRAIARGEIE